MRYARDVNESKALNTQHGPMIIISASGMAEAGRLSARVEVPNGYGAPGDRAEF